MFLEREKVHNLLFNRYSNVSVRTFYRTDRYENQSVMVDFFFLQKNILNLKGMNGAKNEDN